MTSLSWHVKGLAVAVLAVYPLFAFYPFDLRSPQVKNGAERRGDLVVFPAPGIARTESAFSELPNIRNAERFEVLLEVRPESKDQHGPARILTLSHDEFERDLTLGAEWDRLNLRVRTPETDENGLPDHLVHDVFLPREWVSLRIEIARGVLVVDVQGERRLERPLGPNTLSAWDASYPLALGNELTGNRPWLGEIRRAELAIDGARIDLLAGGRLVLPELIQRFHREPRWVPFRYFEPKDALMNLLGFVPFGLALGLLCVAWRPTRYRLLVLAVFGASLFIEAGQLWLPMRYPASDDLLLNTLGGSAGLWLVWVLGRRVSWRLLDLPRSDAK